MCYNVTKVGGGSTEDDITIKLQEIIEMNNALKLALSKGATMKVCGEALFIVCGHVQCHVERIGIALHVQTLTLTVLFFT